MEDKDLSQRKDQIPQKAASENYSPNVADQ